MAGGLLLLLLPLLLLPLLRAMDPNPPGQAHPVWRRHIDREYRLKLIHRLLPRLLGEDGLILEVGYELYNQEVCKTTNISCERWYFVDIHSDPTFTKSTGHLFVRPGGMADLAAEWKHRFRVIIDYGAVGSDGFKWGEANVSRHTAAYSELLEPGGHLLLKIDGFWPNKPMWPLLRMMISKKLVLVHRHSQIHPACPPDRQRGFPTWDSTEEAVFSKEIPQHATGNCETNMYTQWYYPGDLYVLSKD